MTTVPPFPVLDHFAAHTRVQTWRRASSGFSGAVVWLGESAALKMWPFGTTTERLRQIHAWMTAARHLPFVPHVFGVLEHDGRVWDCTQLMPGAPRAAPTADEVARACNAVAELHGAWAERESRRGPCPGVRNRIRVLSENEPLLRAGPNSVPKVSAQLDPLLRDGVSLVTRAAPLAVGALRPWEGREFALHPCVRDLRGEHVLFSDSGVSGIIDYGAAGIDSPASDLARLLDDYAESDATVFDVGLNAYRAARPAFDAPDEFVHLLARSGTICSILGWLVRVVVRREPVADEAAVATRLSQLLSRAGRIRHF